MALLVKICGLKTPDTLDAALDAGADLVGFVFFPPSPRNLNLSAAKLLGARVAGRAGKVALTVDATDDLLFDIVSTLQPDLLQLHGHESPERVGVVRARFGLPVIKALPIAERADLVPIRLYEKVADHILFDARPPREATRPGGLGAPFDWTLLRDVAVPVPFILSGGLDRSNVASALAITGAAGVDVSSGVERAPGEKDIEKIAAFVAAARAAERDLKASENNADKNNSDKKNTDKKGAVSA
jgi:phosphoribosylanthranilate isomerase